ncbi:MAG: 8-amino-7-oxononanoate synthase [Actinomycetota bacterium]|nr:8-amino-7-oxononanoate synthase [Actinomycetota bacterium]
MPSWASWSADEGDAIRAGGQWRQVTDFDPGGAVVSFASNDYLGLTQHPVVVAAAHEALDRWGAGAGAARLVVGSRPVHSELERAIADWKREEAALLFATGYAANLGVLTTIGTAGTQILSDERNHASIVDGCRLAAGRVEVFRHADVDHLEWLLLRSAEPAIVVSDTVFSMDGDVAPVGALAEVCSRAGALLVLDEAHAVLGPDPALDGVEHLRVGTLSKYLGSLGGFVAGTRSMVDLLVNRARPFIFTTAPTPADTAAALAALTVLRTREGEQLKARLRANVDRVQPGHPAPIVGVIVGDENDAMRAAAALLDRNLLVPAIRPPTVPAGTSRLRVTLSAAHTAEQVGALGAALADLQLPAHAS